MIPEKKRPVLLFFAVIYFLFGGALLYFLFLNTGLDIVMETGEKEVKVFLQNSSMHLIRDINVSMERQNREIQQLSQIQKLKPGEKIELQLPLIEKEQIRITATAPFHAKVSRDVSIERSIGAKLSFEVQMQNSAFEEIEFAASIKICNEGEAVNDIKVVEAHGQEFFNERNKTETISLQKGECKKLDFKLTPKKAGLATIYLNVKAVNVSREFERTITILER